jgi:hypothetical protein
VGKRITRTFVYVYRLDLLCLARLHGQANVHPADIVLLRRRLGMLTQTVSAMAVLNGILVSVLQVKGKDMTLVEEFNATLSILGRRRLVTAGADALARCGTEQYQQLLELAQVGAACLVP